MAGYIRIFNKECKLLIPVEIISICFDYWLIKVCDEWDKQFLAEGVEIDGQQISISNNTINSFYGCYSFNTGEHSWQIKLHSDISMFFIGIIEDDEAVLRRYQKSRWHWHANGCCLGSDGQFSCR